MDNIMDVSWQRTLSLAQKGDAAAFEALVTPLEPMVWRVCHRYMKSTEDAQDCAQEAMIKAWRSIGQYRGNASLSTWLYRIAVSCCLDALRAAARRGIGDTLPVDELAEEGITVPDTAPTPEEATLASAERDALRTALADLPDDYREPLELYALEGMGYDAIGKALHVPLGTVKSRIARARIILAKKMCVWREQSPQTAVQQSERRTK